jgi:hypothetical protein
MRTAELEQMMLNHLDTQEWKSVLDLMGEVEKERKQKGRRSIPHHILRFFSSTLDELMWEPSSGKMYIIVAGFEIDRKVESRWRDDPPEVIAKRGGHRAREYRLTNFGRRLRDAEKARAEYEASLHL